MRCSVLFAPTLKKAPAEAVSISHSLMVRAGLIRQVFSGVYSYLPLGLRVVNKLIQIIREEMDAAGGQEFSLPSLQPAELWQETGRLDDYGPDMFKFQDRHGRILCLGPTHEEIITDIVRKEIRSVRDLPKLFYQIKTKFRDEARPRFGVLRTREFTMKDLYSFDADKEGLDISYQKMYEAYCRIFKRCGLLYEILETQETGQIGGEASHEFIVLAESGEDLVLKCNSCKKAWTQVEAPLVCKIKDSREEKKELKEVHTPGIKTVEELCNFLKIKPKNVIKTLLYKILKQDDQEEFIAMVIPGTHEVNEGKLKTVLKAKEIKLAEAQVVEQISNCQVGFSGPVGLPATILIYADQSLQKAVNMTAGANKTDYHLVNVCCKRDFEPSIWADLVIGQEGDICGKCGGTLALVRGIEVGHIFKLGTKYSKAMGASFHDLDGQCKPVIMGCYGLGVERTVAAAVEQNYDEKGIKWPISLAPYEIIVLPLQMQNSQLIETAEKIYKDLKEINLEVVLDDRDVTAGVKFADADLIGYPIKIILGERNFGKGQVEIQKRIDKSSIFVNFEDTIALIYKIRAELFLKLI